MTLIPDELIGQVKDWQGRGLLSEDTADALVFDIQSHKTASAYLQNRVIKIIIVLGSVLVGLGILLFIASNWKYLGNFAKTLLIFAGVVFFHGIGLVWKKREPQSFFPNAFHLIGTITYVGGIVLMGQIYHISGDYAGLLFLAAIGSIPLAYGVVSRPLLSLGLLAGYGWIMRLLFLDGTLGSYYPMVFVLLGISVFLSGEIQEHFSIPPVLTNAFRNLGSITVLATLLIASFQYAKPTANSGLYFQSVQCVAVLAAFCAIITLAFFLRKKKGLPMISLFWLGGLTLLVSLQDWLAVIGWKISPALSGGDNWPYFLIANMSLVAGIAFFFTQGIQGKSKSLADIALAAIVITIFARYIDYFAAFLPRSLAFIVGGILLLAIGVFLEKKRKTLYQQFGIGTQPI